jgi:hypothetical protein
MRSVGLVTRGAATRSPCLRGGLIDADIATAGVQPSCRVEVVSDAGTPLESRSELPRCDAAIRQRCFTLGVDAACAETETQLAFRVDDAAVNETLTVSCDVAD